MTDFDKWLDECERMIEYYAAHAAERENQVDALIMLNKENET